MTPVGSLIVEASRDDSPLVLRLANRLRYDALLTSRRISMQLLEATPKGSERMWRRARILFLLSVDALNGERPEPSRFARWRRFIKALAPFADETKSPALRRIVAENADLLTPRPIPETACRR